MMGHLESTAGSSDLEFAKMQLLPEDMQLQMIEATAKWFEEHKHLFPQSGLLFMANNNEETMTVEPKFESGEAFHIELPPELLTLLEAVRDDARNDEELQGDRLRILLERTGIESSHSEDQTYHLDTWQILWDGAGNRVGYDARRSLDKYMVYIDRPGSFVIHGIINKSLTLEDANRLGCEYHIDSLSGATTRVGNDTVPPVSQLLPNSIYRLAVGDVLHAPPPHADGLLVTVSFNS